jgi:hypothetical protein
MGKKEGTMPGFLDRIKSGADKAAFEADRLLRVTQAQSALKALQREMEAIGQQAVALYDAGTLTQPELLAILPQIDTLRQQIAAQEAEVERIRQEKPLEAPAPGEERLEEAPAPAQEEPPEAPAPAPQGRICPQCQTELPADVRFCPECGSRVEDL